MQPMNLSHTLTYIPPYDVYAGASPKKAHTTQLKPIGDMQMTSVIATVQVLSSGAGTPIITIWSLGTIGSCLLV
jgi:hypothetical protein